MFIVVSHIPSGVADQPTIITGPIAASAAGAIEAWQEHRISSFCEQGSAPAPHSKLHFEKMISELSRMMTAQLALPLPISVSSPVERAYLIEVPPLASSLAALGQSLMKVSSGNSTSFNVYQESFRAPVSAPAMGLTTAAFVAEFKSEESALQAYPGATPTYR